MWRTQQSPWDRLADAVAATAPARRRADLVPCYGCEQPGLDRDARRVMTLFGAEKALDMPLGKLGFEHEQGRARTLLGAFAPEGTTVTGAEAPSPVLLRASNLANVVVVGMRLVPPELRDRGLTEATDPAWAKRVLSLAKGVGIGLEDAVRFSLALHFTLGIIDADAGKPTLEARVYKKVVAAYRQAAAGAEELSPAEAQRRLQGVKAPVKTTLHGLGNTPAPCKPWDLICEAGKVVGGVVKAAEKAGQDAQKAVEQAFNWTNDMLCKGLKWLLGEQFGGLLCALFSTYLNLIKFVATTLIGVAVELARTLRDVVTLLMQGKPKEAALAFLKGATTIVFLVPPMGPVFAVMLGLTTAELTDMARKVADRAPLFVVQVAAAIFGVLAPTPQSIVGVVQALRPAIAIFAGATVAKAFKLATAQVEQAVDSIVSFGCGITLGIVTVAGVATDMAKAVEAKGGDILAAGQAKFGELQASFQRKWDRIVKAFTSFNFKEVVLAVADLAGQEELAGKVLKAAEEAPGKVAETLEATLKSLSPEKLIAQLDPKKLADAFVLQASKLPVTEKASNVAAFLKALPAGERGAFLTELRKAGV